MNGRLGKEVDRILSPEEAHAYLAQPIAPQERQATQELIRWFTGRYPTPADRLSYVRRAYRRWTQARAPRQASS